MQAQDFSKLEHLVTFYSQANNGLPCELRQPAMAPQDRDSITDDETGEIRQGSQIHQNCSDDSTEVMEGVTSTPEIFSDKHSFVLTFFTTNIIYVYCKRCRPQLNH